MTTTSGQLDTSELEQRVKSMYEEVALEPQRGFHFETGRPLAERLGYPPGDLDRIPMTDQQAAKARRLADESGFTQVEFRDGQPGSTSRPGAPTPSTASSPSKLTARPRSTA